MEYWPKTISLLKFYLARMLVLTAQILGHCTLVNAIMWAIWNSSGNKGEIHNKLYMVLLLRTWTNGIAVIVKLSVDTVLQASTHQRQPFSLLNLQEQKLTICWPLTISLGYFCSDRWAILLIRLVRVRCEIYIVIRIIRSYIPFSYRTTYCYLAINCLGLQYQFNRKKRRISFPRRSATLLSNVYFYVRFVVLLRTHV